jgi:hypothetical protein
MENCNEVSLNTTTHIGVSKVAAQALVDDQSIDALKEVIF